MGLLDIDESTDLKFVIYENSIKKLLRKYWWGVDKEFVMEWDGKEPYEYDNLRWKVVGDIIHLKFTSYIYGSEDILNGYHLIHIRSGAFFSVNFNLSWRDIKRYIETEMV
jgi:hypothetical protein